MMKLATVSLAALLAASGCVDPADRVVLAQLEQKVPEVTFEKTPMRNVIQFVRDKSGAHIYVDWLSLYRARVTKHTEIDLQLKDVKLKT